MFFCIQSKYCGKVTIIALVPIIFALEQSAVSISAQNPNTHMFVCRNSMDSLSSGKLTMKGGISRRSHSN